MTDLEFIGFYIIMVINCNKWPHEFGKCIIELNITSEIFFCLKLLLVTSYLEVLAYSREHFKV
jgi:hypothetical protein